MCPIVNFKYPKFFQRSLKQKKTLFNTLNYEYFKWSTLFYQNCFYVRHKLKKYEGFHVQMIIILVKRALVMSYILTV